jgi:ABC-type multidrug transport system ATPase subunit
MGPSGSGKTSMLNAIAGRVPAAQRTRLTGKVVLPGAGDALHRMAYVRQKQSFYPFLSTRETLLFAAGMRMGGCTTQEKVCRL